MGADGFVSEYRQTKLAADISMDFIGYNLCE